MDVLGSVLVVCTANVCRSPLAERVLRIRFAEAGLAAGTGSAGVRAMTGSPMCAVSAQLLPEQAGAAHVARQVDRGAVVDADLTIAMEREQRGALVREAPGSQAKVFTLREAAALAGALVERGESLTDLAAVARAMHGLRGLVAVPSPEPPKRRWFQKAVEPEDALTIPDGHGMPEPQHRAAAEQVRRYAEDLAAALVALLPARDQQAGGRAAPVAR